MAKAAERQLFSFTARRNRGCCVRNYELSFGTRDAAAQDMVSEASRLQIPDVMAKDGKHGQKNWGAPNNEASKRLEKVCKVPNG